MHGALPPSLIAEALLMMAWKFLLFLAPFLAVAALWWLVGQTERIVHWLFPYLEWEHSLGWLNIKAERRARTALRWLGYAVYLLLAATLLGLPFGARGVEQIVDQWPTPPLTADMAVRLLTLAVCVAIWWLYLGCQLVPKLRTEREEAELKKFRAKLTEAELEREKRNPRSRITSSLPKPRQNASQPLVPDRAKRRR